MDRMMTVDPVRTDASPRAARGTAAARLNGDPAAMAKQLPEMGPLTLTVANRNARLAISEEFSDGGWTGNSLWLRGGGGGAWLYPAQWAFAFAVARGAPGTRQNSLQFVDRRGEVDLTVELGSDSGLQAFSELLEQHRDPGVRRPVVAGRALAPVFPGILRNAVDPSLIRELMETLADAAVPVCLELGSCGVLQSYTGLIDNPAPTARGLRVHGAGLRLELDLAGAGSAWVTDIHQSEGKARAVDLFDSAGNRILRLSGQRIHGSPEDGPWRTLVEALSSCTMAS